MRSLLDLASLELQQRSHRIQFLPIVIVYLNNICDSRCVTCSIWKNNELLKVPSERQMSNELLNELYENLVQWRPRQILLSGGEPALHPSFSEAVRRFRAIAGKVCVVTNGLVLGNCGSATLQSVEEFYISFDGPDRDSYLQIRGVDGFDRLSSTLRQLKSLRTHPKIVARCTLQRANVRRIPELVGSARELGFDCISFLGVDTTSTAFSRDIHGPATIDSIQPTIDDLRVMEEAIQSLGDSRLGFVEGGSARLSRILQYFRALLGESEFPAVSCNAPWVSMVIETTGKVRGCFFQPVIGDFRSINESAAVGFRENLDVSQDPTCQRCVCSKFVSLRELAKM
ncbi:MAG TPA: radical SAM protein [Terriglobia bacterium]|nr:radical SAM protein [Terriglobia bacterium]